MTSFPNFQKKLGSGGLDQTARCGARIVHAYMIAQSTLLHGILYAATLLFNAITI
jgi:hypothetical protein